MKNIKMLLLVPAAMIAAACGRDTAKTDDALKNDLALASQAQAYMPQQITSPSEMGYAYNPYTGQFQPVPQNLYPQAQAPAPVVQRVSARPAATTARRTSTASTARASTGTRVVYAERAEPIRHTKRDAAIGAAAGAVIGATVSRDKVKGGLIGAAAGAVLGGIIGHTVDVERPK